MRLHSPAKINLNLRVGPVQSDGFHPLVSWMTTVGLFDTLEFSPEEAGRLLLECSDPSLPIDGQNLVIKAANALRAETGTMAGIRIHLTKTIPAGGGLGGGSGNAATTLVALNTLWQLNLPEERLSAIAARLGSDVAFFLHAPSAICTGRGEITRPIDAPKGFWVVLILPDLAMPTPAVYRKLDQMREAAEPGDDWNVPTDFQSWPTLDARTLLQKLQNDLETPAFALRPDLGQLRAAIEDCLRRPVRMSGSGSTLFTLFDQQDSANEAAARIRSDFSVRTINVPLAVEV